MITAFIDMVGTLMIIPLMPFYAKSFGANGLVVGLLVSSFSIAQLLSAPIWGRFSDRYGRRPALVVGMMASAVAYIVFAYANSLFLLIAVGAIAAEAIRRLFNPSSTSGETVMIVAAVGIAVNAATAFLFSRGREHDRLTRTHPFGRKTRRYPDA